MKTNESVLALIQEYGVDYSKWGLTSPKTIEKFFEYVLTGEYELVVENGKLINLVSFIDANVVGFVGGVESRLYETQYYHTGKVVTGRPDIRSFGEKMQPGEKPLTAVIRGCKEELGLDINPDSVDFDFSEVAERDSAAFPGLPTRYTKYGFTIKLNTKQICDEYVEDGDDKKTIFRWRKIST